MGERLNETELSSRIKKTRSDEKDEGDEVDEADWADDEQKADDGNRIGEGDVMTNCVSHFEQRSI